MAKMAKSEEGNRKSVRCLKVQSQNWLKVLLLAHSTDQNKFHKQAPSSGTGYKTLLINRLWQGCE